MQMIRGNGDASVFLIAVRNARHLNPAFALRSLGGVPHNCGHVQAGMNRNPCVRKDGRMTD